MLRPPEHNEQKGLLADGRQHDAWASRRRAAGFVIGSGFLVAAGVLTFVGQTRQPQQTPNLRGATSLYKRTDVVDPFHNGPNSGTIVFYSAPFELRYGEVSPYVYRGSHPSMDAADRVGLHYAISGAEARSSRDAVPAHVRQRYHGDHLMAITGYTWAVVKRGPSGEEVPVPYHEVYNHHASIHIMTDIVNNTGGIQTAEFTISVDENAPAVFKRPFRQIVREPSDFTFQTHLIRLRHDGMGPYDGRYSPMSMCRCKPGLVNLERGEIDGKAPFPDFDNNGHGVCPAPLDAENNTACALSTYIGGVRCCSDGFVTMTPDDCERAALPASQCHSWEALNATRQRYYFKGVIDYEDVTPTTLPLNEGTATEPNVKLAHARTGQGMHEYDARPCPAGTPPSQCTHTLEFTQPIEAVQGRVGYDPLVPEMWDIHQAAPHVHTTALSLELQDAETGRTICRQSRAGGGLRYEGPEGLLTYLDSCVWEQGTMPRLNISKNYRTIAVYNATAVGDILDREGNPVGPTGLMAQWRLHAVPVPGQNPDRMQRCSERNAGLNYPGFDPTGGR